MATVAILEGSMGFDNISYPYQEGNDVALLGKRSFLRRVASRTIKKVTRPIRKITRPITRPLDRVLKKIPVVRTVYRAGITQAYASTLQFKKIGGGARRTGRSAVKDISGAKRIIMRIAVRIVTPLAKKGMAKTAAKVTAIPAVSGIASTTIGPWSIPFVAGIVNIAINKVWKSLKGVGTRVTRRALSSVSNKLTGSGNYDALKMRGVPGLEPPGFDMNFTSQPAYEEPPKKAGGAGILLALAPLALLMGT